MYEVYLERSAENDLKRLPTSIFHRIIPQIKTLAANPRPSGCRKITGSKNDWRIRIGDRKVPCKPRLVGGVKGHNINDITLPGSAALWAGSFTIVSFMRSMRKPRP